MTVKKKTSPKSASLTLRALAVLLTYPDAQMRGHLDELRDALRRESAVSDQRLNELDALIEQLSGDAYEVESGYVELFDRGRATSLHLFEHVHGDSRARGPAMIDLAQTYETAGLYLAPGELPDYLPVVLEFASTQPAREATAFLGEIAHLLNAIHSALARRDSRYAAVLAALVELAGETVQGVETARDEGLDDTWAEPPVFDGCSSAGQSKPGRPQPIQIIRKAGHTGVQP